MNSTTLTRVGKSLTLGLLNPVEGYGLEVKIQYDFYSFSRIETAFFREGEYNPEIVAQWVEDTATTKTYYYSQHKGYECEVTGKVVDWKYHKSFNQSELPNIADDEVYKVGFPRYPTGVKNGIHVANARLDYWYFSSEEKEGITDYINEHNRYSEDDLVVPFSIEVVKDERKSFDPNHF